MSSTTPWYSPIFTFCTPVAPEEPPAQFGVDGQRYQHVTAAKAAVYRQREQAHLQQQQQQKGNGTAMATYNYGHYLTRQMRAPGAPGAPGGSARPAAAGYAPSPTRYAPSPQAVTLSADEEAYILSKTHLGRTILRERADEAAQAQRVQFAREPQAQAFPADAVNLDDVTSIMAAVKTQADLATLARRVRQHGVTWQGVQNRWRNIEAVAHHHGWPMPSTSTRA